MQAYNVYPNNLARTLVEAGVNHGFIPEFQVGTDGEVTATGMFLTDVDFAEAMQSFSLMCLSTNGYDEGLGSAPVIHPAFKTWNFDIGVMEKLGLMITSAGGYSAVESQITAESKIYWKHVVENHGAAVLYPSAGFADPDDFEDDPENDDNIE